MQEAASLVTPIVLIAQATSIAAPDVFLASLLIQPPEDVLPKLSVLMVKISVMEFVPTSVTLDSSSMKEFASMEDASMDILPTRTVDASGKPKSQLAHNATPTNSSPTEDASAHATTDSILTLTLVDALPAQPIA